MLPGWFRPSNASLSSELGASSFEISLTVGSSVDAFDAAAFEATLRSYLQCEEGSAGEPGCCFCWYSCS